jgi:hypothetical protein
LHAGIPVAALPLVASAGMLCKFSLTHTHTNKSTENYLDLLPDMDERSHAGGVSSSSRYASHDGTSRGAASGIFADEFYSGGHNYLESTSTKKKREK